ncbi:insulinase family protein [Pontibaca salina]|uniref:Insulinase family protein n=1 Tax=Pontibaca salina TaxID=2795731 RepID=A0A934M0Z5_9RHOB|nr:insulinase family protein [Pontibaca salina]MBI6629156.1 insulinase family protein [Pontibaca salina]
MTRSAVSGFTEVATGEIAEIHTRFRHFRHDRTGAEAVFLLNADAVQTFSIAFRTYPTDSTGIAHVLEHCVLSGSRAYPIGRPFEELLKGSLQSYLNASTNPDFTIFPVASPHPQDFSNLVDVYLDAVFFPLLTEESFRREGWHQTADGSYQGVVLSELRGVYAASEYISAEQARRSLFRAGPYSHAHGGDPAQITDLTHAAMKHFHRRYYQPSNTLAAFSGVADIAGELRRLDRVFSQFERRPPPPLLTGSVISSRKIVTFGHSGGGPSCLALNWAFPRAKGRLAELAYDVLCEVVVGQPFAPLRRALIDGGYCTDIAEGRFLDDTAPPRLSVRLTGVDPERISDVERVTRETIEQVMRKGYGAQALAGAVNAVEFRCRDRGTWKRPHAVGLLQDLTKAWRLGRDPRLGLGFARELAEIRRQPAECFEAMMKTHLLDNPHFALVVLTPDGMPSKRARKVPSPPRPSNAARRKPQASTGIPHLTLQDLSPEPVALPLAREQVSGVPVLFHHRPTNGLTYVDLAFDLQGIAQLSCVALFGRIWLQSGTTCRSAQDMALRIGTETGGLSCQVVCPTMGKGQGAAAHLLLRARALTQQAPCLFDILGELLSEVEIPEPPQLAKLVASEIIRLRAQILPKAHEFLDRRLRAQINGAEQTDGLNYLQFLHDFQRVLRRDPDQARQRLEDLQRAIWCRKRLVISIIHDQSGSTDLLRRAERLIVSLSEGDRAKSADTLPVSKRSEAFIVPGEANFVGMAFDTRNQPACTASFAVALRWLETGWLRQRIRDENGAYGVLCRGDAMSGISTFLSYRDPHILPTLDVFSAAGQQLAHGISKEDLTRAIIATIGALERPRSPPDCGLQTLTDWLAGWTTEHRNGFRAAVLATEPDDLEDAGNVLSSAATSAHIVILGGKEALAQVLAQRPHLVTLNDLPGN